MMLLVNVLQILLLLAGAPLLSGLVAWMKAKLQRRRGSSPLRPYAELIKLFLKQDLAPAGSSWLFRMAPPMAFAAIAGAALMTPVLQTASLMGRGGDIIILVYLLAIARFMTGLGALDSGTSFAGMGASREMMVAALAELPLLLGLIAVAIKSGSIELAAMSSATLNQNFLSVSPVHLLALSAVVLAALAETGRMPVDSPDGHLELTMIHHAMQLEYSGPSLAWLDWAASLKLNLLMAVMIALFAPWGMAQSAAPLALVLALVIYLGKLLVMAAALALLESSVAKMRVYRVPDFLGIASAIGVLAVLFTVIGTR